MTDAMTDPTTDPPPAPDIPRYAAERQQEIAEALQNAGRVQVNALALRYGVSEDTIRRDLRALAARGLVQKTHGGAVALNTSLLPARQRADLLPAAKQAIADAAAAWVQPHQTLFIDAGSTTLALARALREAGSACRPLTVVTHALDVMLALADDPQIRLVLAGGLWLPTQRIFGGPQAAQAVAAWRADIAFLGACALHPRTGLTATEPDEAPVKRAMVDGAALRVVLGDHSKLDQIAPCAVAALDEVDRVISDRAVDWLAGRQQIVRAAAEAADPAGSAGAAAPPGLQGG
ncbi:MAG: hypothetical protein RLY78_1822 [Pseudomonadota bacterium]|jgi:DeoR family glycerol-3-phosphate regulon repressor